MGQDQGARFGDRRHPAEVRCRRVGGPVVILPIRRSGIESPGAENLVDQYVGAFVQIGHGIVVSGIARDDDHSIGSGNPISERRMWAVNRCPFAVENIERLYGDALISVDDAGRDIVSNESVASLGVWFVHRALGDVERVSRADSPTHPLGSEGSKYVERLAPVEHPGGEKQVGKTRCVVGMMMGEEGLGDVAERQPGDAALVGVGDPSAHAGTEVEHIGDAVDCDRRRRTRSARFGSGRAGSYQYNVCRHVDTLPVDALAQPRRGSTLQVMALRSDQGIVLRGYSFGEADRIIVLISPNHGKIRTVAKGVRKTKSRFGGRLEPLTHVDLVLYEGRNLDTITQVSVIAAFPHLRLDLDAVLAASTMAEAIDKVVVEGEPSHRLFLLLQRGLKALESGVRGQDLVTAFLLKMMDATGQAPALSHCASCGRGEDLNRFSLGGGGVICDTCGTSGAVRLRPGLIGYLALLSGADFADMPPGDPSLSGEAVGIARRFVEYHIETQLDSLAVLNG